MSHHTCCTRHERCKKIRILRRVVCRYKLVPDWNFPCKWDYSNLRSSWLLLILTLTKRAVVNMKMVPGRLAFSAASHSTETFLACTLKAVSAFILPELQKKRYCSRYSPLCNGNQTWYSFVLMLISLSYLAAMGKIQKNISTKVRPGGNKIRHHLWKRSMVLCFILNILFWVCAHCREFTNLNCVYTTKHLSMELTSESNLA